MARGRVALDDDVVELAQELMSEVEVLEMKLHDEHYAGGVMRPLHYAGSPPLPQCVGIVTTKYPAQNVTGNIGEGLGLTSTLKLLGLSLTDAIRIRRRKTQEKGAARRLPDFLLVRPSSALDVIQKTLFERDQAIPGLAEFPERVPLECKGSFKRCNAFWSGLWQLIEYW